MVCFKHSKRIHAVFLLIALVILFIGCKGIYPSEWGKILKYEGSKLFHTSVVSQEQARKLGDYLLESGFFQKDNPGTVQITKEGDVYQFRMVVKGGKAQDMEFLKIAGMFAAQLSKDVFDNEMVEMHLCDKNFETVQTVSFLIQEDQEE